MTTEQPEALRLAEILEGDYCPDWFYEQGVDEVSAELLRQHTRIAELEAQLEAIGAGGVEPLRKISEQPAQTGDAVATQWLAEMIMSDCGCSTENKRLLDRIIDRIQQYDRASAAPQPSTAAQGDALSDAVRVPLDSLHADAAYLIGRLREGSMPYARVIEIIRERINAAVEQIKHERKAA